MLLRANDFEGFASDRQRRLLALIEKATGKAPYSGAVAEEGEDIVSDPKTWRPRRQWRPHSPWAWRGELARDAGKKETVEATSFMRPPSPTALVRIVRSGLPACRPRDPSAFARPATPASIEQTSSS